MSDVETENDEDRFDMFDLSMSIVCLLKYVEKKTSLTRYFKDIDVLSGKVRDQCRNEKYRIQKLKGLSRQLEKENGFLKKRVEQMYGENNRLRSEMDNLKKKLEKQHYYRKRSGDNRRLKEAEDELVQLRHDFECQKKVDVKRKKDFEKESNEIILSQENKIKNLEKEASRRGHTITELTKRLNEFGSDMTKPDKSRHELPVEISKLQKVLQHTLTQLHDKESELKETQIRLSKVMGARLTDNNPNIADLSDTNRPTKLAERYTELYDNQWSDAFELINRYYQSETKTIEILLYILQDTMAFCKRKETEQLHELVRAFEMSYKQGHKKHPIEVPKYLKECRKSYSLRTAKNLYEMYSSHIRSSGDQVLSLALEIDRFTKECIELCWLMVIQDPPIVFADDTRRGSKFDTNLFKAYTSTGTNVDYLVWPALLLCRNGPVLAKGVAQGYGRKSGYKENKVQLATSEDDDYILLKEKDTTDSNYFSKREKKVGKTSKKDSKGFVDQRHFENAQRHDIVRNTGLVPIGFDLINTD